VSDLVTTGQAARILGVPPRALAVWRHRKKVPAAGVLRGRGRGGRVPIYHLEDLRPFAEEYAATRREATGNQGQVT
jgi:hypothetical protein